MKGKIESELPEEQAGFRAGRSASDMLVLIQTLIEKVSAQEEVEATITFIDYSKAFDSVSHSQLFTIMGDMGFPLHVITLIHSLYVNHSAVVRWADNKSEEFPISKGVRQGCILSPSLFSIYTESIMREANIDEYGISIGGRLISNARYADDTALISKSTEMQHMLDKVNEAGEQRLLKLNSKKTKLMQIGKPRTNIINVSVNGQPIEEVSNFKYLGANKYHNGDCSKDIAAKIAIAKHRMTELTPLWKDKDVPVRLKMKLVKAMVWTTLSYGSEAWTIKINDERRIQSAEMWMWRRMMRVSWTERRSDEDILKELDVQRELLAFIRKRKLSYFGHMCRPSGCQITKATFQGKVNGKRRRGRPRMQYGDNIHMWCNRPLIDCTRAAEDRNGWKKIVKEAMVTARLKL